MSRRLLAPLLLCAAAAVGVVAARWSATPSSPPAPSVSAPNRGQEALTAAWSRVQADSRNPAAWASLGDAQTAMDDLVGAEQAYLTAVRLGSRDPTVHGRLGFALYAEGLDERALTALRYARAGGAQLPLLDHTIGQLQARLATREPPRPDERQEGPAQAAPASPPASSSSPPPPAPVAPPDLLPPPVAPPLAAGPCEVPLRRSPRTGVYLVEVRIEGVPATLVFDTGATATALTRDLLRRAGVRVDEDRIAHALTASGPVDFPTARVGRVELAGREARDVIVAVCDACAADGAEGLLGLDVQSAAGAELVVQRSVLRLTGCGGP